MTFLLSGLLILGKNTYLVEIFYRQISQQVIFEQYLNGDTIFMAIFLNVCLFVLLKFVYIYMMQNYYGELEQKLVTPSDYTAYVKGIKQSVTLEHLKQHLSAYRIQYISYLYDIKEHSDKIKSYLDLINKQ